MVVRRRRPHHWMDGMMEPLGSVMPLLVQPTGTRLLDTVGRVVPVNDEWDEDVDVVASTTAAATPPLWGHNTIIWTDPCLLSGRIRMGTDVFEVDAFQKIQQY